MVRIIVSVVLLVLLAVLVALNIGFTAKVNLFGAQFDGVPVVAISALSFAIGIVYSLFLYAGRFLHQRARQQLATKKKSVAEREKQVAARETNAEAVAEAPRAGEAPRAAEPPAGGVRAAFSRFFDSLRR
jgi:uncharacterized integral membrane protein